MPIIQPVSHICQLKWVIPVYFLYPAHRVSSSTPPKVFVLSTHTVSYYIDVCNSCCNTECTNRNVWYSNSFVECGVFSGSFLFSSRTIISLISDHIPTYQCQHAMNKYLYWWRKSTPLGTWPRLVFIDVHITLYSIIFLSRWCSWRRYDMETLSVLLALCQGNPPGTSNLCLTFCHY